MKRKTIIFAALMAAVLASAPLTTMAQENVGRRGLFNQKPADSDAGGSGGSWGSFNNSSTDDNGNGSWGGFNHTDPNEEPLTDGVLLLAAAGMGYAALKRKKKEA